MTTLTRSTAICLVLAALSGCDRPSAQVAETKRLETVTASTMEMVVHIDPETGCQYLRLYSSGHELTPRIAADGRSHMGCKGSKP